MTSAASRRQRLSGNNHQTAPATDEAFTYLLVSTTTGDTRRSKKRALNPGLAAERESGHGAIDGRRLDGFDQCIDRTVRGAGAG